MKLLDITKIFYHQKEESWENWRRFARKNNFLFSLIQEEEEKPIMRGIIGGRSVSMEAIKTLQNNYLTKTIFPLNNFKNFYLLLEEKNILESREGMFQKSFTIQNDSIKQKYTCKSNSEVFQKQFLNSDLIQKAILKLENHSIEVINFECIFRNYQFEQLEVNFSEKMKVYYEVLSELDQIYLNYIR